MTSRWLPETTKQLRAYCTALDQIASKSSHISPADLGRKLAKWSDVMHTLLEHLHGSYSSRGSIREVDHAEDVWSLLMYGIPETLVQLEIFPEVDSCHYNPVAPEDLSERVQFHLTAINLLSCYYERYITSNAFTPQQLMSL